MALKGVSILGLLLLTLSCSGAQSETRTSTTDRQPEGATSKNDGVTSDENSNVAKSTDVVPISGMNFTKVLVFASCVKDASNSCKKVRLGANITVGSASAVRFAAATVAALGIKESSWKFQDLPSGVTCQSDADGFVYNPLCTSSTSLNTQRIKATLTLKSSDGTSVKGDSPDAAPSHDNIIYGNFMKLSAASGFSPSGTRSLHGEVVCLTITELLMRKQKPTMALFACASFASSTRSLA